jgi:hypothetical protein
VVVDWLLIMVREQVETRFRIRRDHRTRWRALHEFMAQRHVPPAQIQGGFEFDDWYSNNNYTRREEKHGADYVLAAGLATGFEVVGEYRFTTWLPPRSGTMFVLHRAGLQPRAAQSR